MKVQKFLTLIMLLSMGLIFSCTSDDEMMSQRNNVQDTANGTSETGLQNSFTSVYSEFSSMERQVYEEMSEAGPINMDNAYIQDYLKDNPNHRILWEEMEGTFEKYRDLELDQAFELLEKEGAISKEQMDFLIGTKDKLFILGYKEASRSTLENYLTETFETEKLNQNFNEQDVELLQYFGCVMLKTTKVLYVPGSSQKSCDSWIQIVICRNLAAAAVANMLLLIESSGIFPVIVPHIFFNAVYEWCCEKYFGDGDPCAEIVCPPGYICVDGVCVAGPCIGVICPPGYHCEDGDCVK